MDVGKMIRPNENPSLAGAGLLSQQAHNVGRIAFIVQETVNTQLNSSG
jgi:hypothetical protein